MKRVVFLIAAVFFVVSIAHAELRIMTTEEPPTNFKHDGKLIGTTVDIVYAIIEKLKLKTSIEVMPWARAYSFAKTEPDIVVFTCGRSQERIDHGFYFIGPVITRKHALFKKADNPLEIESLATLKKMGLKIGALRGDWREKYIKDLGLLVDSSSSYPKNLNKLLRNRYPLMISSDIEMPPLLQEMKLPKNIVKLAFVFKEASSYIMISKDTDKSVVSMWQNAFDELKQTDFFEKTASKYSSILGFGLGFAPATGFYVN